MKFRIGFKHVLKSPCKSSYSFFDTYYDDAFEAYQDTYECEQEEKDAGIKMYGYYIIQDFDSKRVYSLDAFKKLVLNDECGLPFDELCLGELYDDIDQ